MDYNYDMPPYVQQMADWLDNDKSVHPCCFDHAYQGFEIMSALYRSVAEGGQISLPLTAGADEIALLSKKSPTEESSLRWRRARKNTAVVAADVGARASERARWC